MDTEGWVALKHIKALIDFIGGLEVTQGHGVGGAFPVLPWQRRFLNGAFADHADESALSIVARANGKTTLCAAIAAACLDGPLVSARGPKS